MAVKHCSKAGAAGWHNALTLRLKRCPLSNQNTLLACLHMYLLGDQWSALID